jgi:hypothetical protein
VDRAGRDDDRVGCDGQPPVGGASLHRDRAVAAHRDAFRARAGARDGAGGARGREVGLARMLLGAGRAAERAHAAALAPARVAPQVSAGPAEPLGAAAGERGVGARELGRYGRDAESGFDAIEDGRERFGRELLEAELLAPAMEHAVGGAEAGARVDKRRAADPAPERQHDRRAPERRDLAAVAVQPRHHVARPPGQLVCGMVATLLEHDHPRAALGELLRDDGAAGAGADDAHVSAQRARA